MTAQRWFLSALGVFALPILFVFTLYPNLALAKSTSEGTLVEGSKEAGFCVTEKALRQAINQRLSTSKSGQPQIVIDILPLESDAPADVRTFQVTFVTQTGQKCDVAVSVNSRCEVEPWPPGSSATCENWPI